jgi:molecular chaperone GrpE
MPKANGKTETDTGLDVDHELPPAEDDGSSGEQGRAGGGNVSASELQKLTAERDEWRDRFARAQAEFENARKRTAKEQQDFREYAAVDAIKPLLPVLDSFERALRVKSDTSDFRSGVELIYKQLQDALSKLGVQAIHAKGEPFDPRYHEAIEMVETGNAADHEVLEELQRGYKFKDRLLRPAMVKVARNPNR